MTLVFAAAAKNIRNATAPKLTLGGILPGSRISVFEINGVIQLVPVKTPSQYRGLLTGLRSVEVPNEPERF